MKKIRYYLIAAGILACLTGIKFIFFPSPQVKGGVQEKKGKEAKKPVGPVSVFVVGNADFEDHLLAGGTVVANEEAALRAEASGIITYLNLPEGKTVKAGTLLLKVNDADLRAQFARINIQLKLAADSEMRQRKLLKVSGSSVQEYEVALAALESLRADSAYQQALICKTEIRAPFDGIIGIRQVSIGSYITPSVTVAYIHQIDPVKIDFSLPEKYSSFFKPGDQIHFHTENLSGQYTARIAVKDPVVDAGSRNVRYRAVSPNHAHQMLPGTFVQVKLFLQNGIAAVFVPTEAVIPVLSGKKVFVLKNGLAEERFVETGLRTADHVQILSGLSPGDSVVVKGNFQLKQGSAVKLARPEKKKP